MQLLRRVAHVVHHLFQATQPGKVHRDVCLKADKERAAIKVDRDDVADGILQAGTVIGRLGLIDGMMGLDQLLDITPIP